MDEITGMISDQVDNIDATQEEKSNETYTGLVIHADFSDTEKADVIRLIRDEMTRINTLYAEKQWFEKCEKADKEYEGIHTDTTSYNGYNPDVKLLLTTLTIDIIASRAYRQTWTPDPFVQMDAEKEIENVTDIIGKRCDILDYICRKNSGQQDLSIPVYRAACKYGAAPVKTFYDHSTSYKTENVTYYQEDVDKFEKRYIKNIRKGEGKDFDDWTSLRNGLVESVVRKELNEYVTFHGAKNYRVDFRKFYARPDIKEMEDQPTVCELFNFSGHEVDKRGRNGLWYEEAVDKIKENSQNDFYTKDHDFYEAEVLFDRKENGKPERFIVTFDASSEEIVRAIYSPYKKSCYTVYNVFERDHSWIGYSITERMEDIVAVANSVMNSYIKEQDLAHTPIIVASGRQIGDWNIKIGQPNLLPVDMTGLSASGMMQYRMETVSTDRLNFLRWIQGYIAILTGVDPALQSGASTPDDPRAPAAKTAMKMNASTMRIEDMIIVLQKGDAKVAEKTEQITYKFDSDKNKYSTNIKGKNTDITLVEASLPVRYVIAGSRMSFDSAQDLAVVMQTIDFINKFFPEVAQDPEVRKQLLSGVIINSQGTVEKMKDIMTKPIELMIKAATENKKSLASVLDKVQEQGGNPADFMKFLATRGQAQQPQAQPGAPMGNV